MPYELSIDYDLVIGIDPGTIYQGLAYHHDDDFVFGHAALLGLSRQTTLEEFAHRLYGCREYRMMLSALKTAEKIAVFIERPDLWIARKAFRTGSDKAESRRFQQQVATYWRRIIEKTNPAAQVTRISSLDWQRALLPRTLGHNKDAFKAEAMHVASLIAGKPMINPHAADAVCLVHFGTVHHLANQQLIAPSL